MGQSPSCGRSSHDHFFKAVEAGDLAMVESSLRMDSDIFHHTTLYDRLSPLHIAAANGRLEVLSRILDRSVHPDLLDRHKQTPLMLAAMHNKIACLQKLLQAGANILTFDSLHGRTCLHYAAYYGRLDCLQAIVAAARTTPIADSWGFARFVNVRDGNGATPLHLAAKQGWANCLHILLGNGALVSASTGGYSYQGSTPLHLAARGGYLDCVRELLAWGADRKQRDSSGRIPYIVASKRKHRACAALLNPSSAEPLVWPSPLKFMSELKPDAKALLEAALMDANKGRDKNILKGTTYPLPSPVHSEGEIDNNDNGSEGSDMELCCICFDQICTIEVQDCGHQMCAHCTLVLCCHSKPNPATLCLPAPLCPFCRSIIAQLVVAKTKIKEEGDKDSFSKPCKLRKSQNLSSTEGSSSFKGLSSAMGSLGKMGSRDRESGGKRADGCDMMEKP